MCNKKLFRGIVIGWSVSLSHEIRRGGGNHLIISCLLVINLLFGTAFPSFSQNVGIGTTTPQAQLHIQISSSYFQPALLVDVQGAPVPHLIITPDGKVGIGVSSPSERLEVSGNVRFSGALMPAGNAGTAGQVLVSQGPGLAPQWQDATTVGGDNWGSQVAQTQAPIVGDGTSSNPIGLQSGTASGDILVWDGSQWVVQQPSVSTGVAPICSSPTTDYVQKWTGSELCNSLIVDNGSEVGVGVASPVARLHVEAPSTYANALFVVRHDTNSASNPFFIVTRDGRVGVGTANPVMKFEIDYPVSSPAFVVTSDERFKEGIESISEGGSVLERVVRLRGVYYYWNEAYRELGRGDDRRHIGLIAQEVKEEFPELVYEWSDGSGYLMVDYDGMVPVLLEAIKELADLVEAQSQKVDELESLKGLIHLIEVQSRRIEELERRVLELETGSGVSSR